MTGTSEEYEKLAAQAGRDLEGASPQEVLAWAASTFGQSLCVASSMSDAVLVHLAATVMPGVDVLFLDTGYHFAETLALRRSIEATCSVNVIDVRPEQTVDEQDATWGRDLFASDPDLCCGLRKVVPLRRALRGYEAWVTGLRRTDGAARAATPVVSWDRTHAMVKVCPIAGWTDADVDRYVADHGLERHALGLRSVGCRPCTAASLPDQDPRAGRWPGFAKSECGIHQ